MEKQQELRRSYERTTYVIDAPGGELSFRVGELNPGLDRLLEELDRTEWAFITPENPRSEQVEEQENRRLYRSLLDRVRELGFDPLPSRGIDDDGTWPTEHGLFIPGIPAAVARGLGREYQQNAIVRGELRSAPELALCAL